MLKLFEVEGYKNFKTKISLDFSNVREYKFNEECLTDGLIGKMLIYGKNSQGKTNFGKAISDVMSVLFPELASPEEGPFDKSYFNVHRKEMLASFRYIFQFEKRTVEYIYKKKDFHDYLSYEKVLLDGVPLFEYDRKSNELKYEENLKAFTPTLILNFNMVGAALRFIINNTALDDSNPLKKTSEFVSKMYMASVSNSLGKTSRGRRISLLPTLKENVEEFNEFFNDFGITENMKIIKDFDGEEKIYFDTDPPLPFLQIASSGTLALLRYLVLRKQLERGEISFLFLDEFDAFYHFELAEGIVEILKHAKSSQVILTTHNNDLCSNKYLRPDCCFTISNNKITSFADATNRELREGHNIGKLNRSGEFDD